MKMSTSSDARPPHTPPPMAKLITTIAARSRRKIIRERSPSMSLRLAMGEETWPRV